MEYLRGNLAASATGLFVICSHLDRYTEGCTEEDLRRSLQLLSTGAEDSVPILAASLAVGEGLGLLVPDQANSAWAVDPLVGSLLEMPNDPWPAFRGELLRKISEHALAALSAGTKVPDLVGALTIFVQSDPLSPLTEDWGQGPEASFEELGSSDVANSTQWNAFKRWATSLGLARRANSTKPGVVIPDASTAISDQLHVLPVAGNARDWIAALRDRLPILGSVVLTSQLPQGPAWNEVPPAVVLGLLKLERSGVLELEPSDDASDVISIGLGATSRQIGSIKVVSPRV